MKKPSPGGGGRGGRARAKTPPPGGGAASERPTHGPLILTLGHSNRTLEDFLALCRAHGAGTIVDVRRFPASRRHPHFARAALELAARAAGLDYRWLEALGGRRSRLPDSPHSAWKVAAFAGYADHMDTGEFRAAAREVFSLAEDAALRGAPPPAVLCAEALPQQCHRRLISDWLVVHGARVAHAIAPARLEEHTLTPFLRVENERLIYDGGQPSLV